jgi:hypothetical protein
MQILSRNPSNSLGLGRYTLLRHSYSMLAMERSDFLFLSLLFKVLG